MRVEVGKDNVIRLSPKKLGRDFRLTARHVYAETLTPSASNYEAERFGKNAELESRKFGSGGRFPSNRCAVQ